MADPKRPGVDDDVLKRAYQATHVSPGGPHLSETEWEQLACGELDEASRERALAHIATCADCATVHRSVLQVSRDASAFDPNAIAPSTAPRPAASRWMLIGGLAAAAAIVAAVVLNRPITSGGTVDTVRAPSATTTMTVITPLGGARLEARRFAWPAVAAADAYEIRVNAADGGAVWTARSSVPEVEIPGATVLTPGTYYWQVTAMRDAVAIGASPIVPFRVE